MINEVTKSGQTPSVTAGAGLLLQSPADFMNRDKPMGETRIKHALPPADIVRANAREALAEDVGDGDITAALIPEGAVASARVITREPGILCGQAWVESVFELLDPAVAISWKFVDGEPIAPDDVLFTLQGPARSLLTGERCALNFLQFLSGTATTCRRYADLVEGTGVKLLDTRKTIPGLRLAQKYAVACGGCFNHRIGLFDAFLIKENHIHAAGGIAEAVTAARLASPGKMVEVEVETLDELRQALDAGCDRVMLDNFTLDQMRQGVLLADGALELEVSGNVTDQTLRAIAGTGVDYISIGALTKDCRALDLSMRLL